MLEHQLSSPVSLTQYVAKHELSTLEREITAFMRAGTVRLRLVKGNDANYKRLQKRGVHKGEAEVIAWLLSIPKKSDRPIFVTRDTKAGGAAAAEGLLATDIMGLVVDLLTLGVLTEPEAQAMLAIWDDKSQQCGRPIDWSGFTETLARRRARAIPWAPKI